jgi:hypothetical protein
MQIFLAANQKNPLRIFASLRARSFDLPFLKVSYIGLEVCATSTTGGRDKQLIPVTGISAALIGLAFPNSAHY